MQGIGYDQYPDLSGCGPYCSSNTPNCQDTFYSFTYQASSNIKKVLRSFFKSTGSNYTISFDYIKELFCACDGTSNVEVTHYIY
jgi:hypothetical protein